MKYRVRKAKEHQVTQVLALHLLCMPFDDVDIKQDDAHWLVYDETDTPVAFASAKFRKKDNYVYFSRAGVLPCARGAGLQKRLIKARLNWAKKVGADTAYTYTVLKNYPSMLNLLKCGFKFYEPTGVEAYVGEEYHYFCYEINKEEGA